MPLRKDETHKDVGVSMVRYRFQKPIPKKQEIKKPEIKHIVSEPIIDKPEIIKHVNGKKIEVYRYRL